MQNQPASDPFAPGGPSPGGLPSGGLPPGAIPPALPLPLRDGINPFIRRTYTVFIISLLGICVSGFLSYLFLPRSSFIPLAIIDGLMWVACGWFGWRRPALLVLPLFSLITGLFLGQVAHYS